MHETQLFRRIWYVTFVKLISVWYVHMYISNNFSLNWNRLERFYSFCLCNPGFLIKAFYFNDPIKHPAFDEEKCRTF